MEDRELIRKIPVFKNISDESAAELAAKGILKDFKPGAGIIGFGEPGTVFGVVVQGEVEASAPVQDGRRTVLKTLKPYDHFGEVSLMTGEPTTADVTAKSAAKVLLIPHRDIAPVIAREPLLAATLAVTISKRLLEREKNLKEAQRLEEARKAQADPYGIEKFDLPAGGFILTVNCGSSSLKYCLYDGRDAKALVKGQIERIGIKGTKHVFDRGEGKKDEMLEGAGFVQAFDAMVRILGGKESLSGIVAVGHRVVHGGEYAQAVIIDSAVMAEIRRCEKLAPLHIPANIIGIEQATRVFPGVHQVAVFDTSFHNTIPRHHRVYGLPYSFFEKEGVRKYGYHGTSHKYVSLKAASFLKKPVNELKLITCHLGNGASLAAIDHGRCVDTSMGMSTIEGLLMGTRCGDLDPGALLHVMKERKLSADEMEKMLLKESGLLGLSGISSDMREIEAAAEAGNDRAILAIQVFCYRIRKYLGAFWTVLGGLDALVFTAGIGEKSPIVRAMVCQDLRGIGIALDEEANRKPSFGTEGAACISVEESPVKVLVVPTDEEKMIARETARAVSRLEVTRILRNKESFIPIGVSAHHVHLSKDDVEALFGAGRKLTVKSPLTQPGQFACNEQVNLVGPRGRVDRVRVLGPERKESQVEISRTEEFKLGIDAPIRMSGDLDGTPGLTLEGSEGSVQIKKGVICARRHIHMTPEDALGFGIRDKDTVLVEVEGERSLIFGDVTVRVDPNFKLELHLDTDEANAAEVNSGMRSRLNSIQSRR